MRYLGPYGFFLLTSLILLFSYYLLSWKLYPDIHNQVFSLLWELTKSDIRFIFIPLDVALYYLGITLFVVLLIAGNFKAGSVIYKRLKEIKERGKKESENLDKLRKLLPEKLYLLAEKHKDLVLRVAERFGKLPASKGHHHSEEYGLLKHSLETALKLVEKKEQISAALGVDERTAERVAVILGLFHDIGKVYPEVPFKYQNALAGYEMGKLGVELHSSILARVIYAITVEHSDFAKLENDHLVAILTAADTESVKEEKLQKLGTCLEKLVSNLLTRLEELRPVWNDRRFFKVVVNPSRKEILINLNELKEIYNLLGCRFPLFSILEEGIKKGFVKPVEGEVYGRFKVGRIGTFPAVVFNLEKLPIGVEGVSSVPDYVVDKYEEFRNRFLEALKEILPKVDLNDTSSPVVFYRDSQNREWYLVKASALEMLKEKGINVSTLKELSSLTGLEIKQVKRIGTKALRVPVEMIGEGGKVTPPSKGKT